MAVLGQKWPFVNIYFVCEAVISDWLVSKTVICDGLFFQTVCLGSILG